MYKTGFRQKLTAIILTICITFYSVIAPITVSIAYAQEATDTTPAAEPTTTQAEPTPTQTTETTPTPTPIQSGPTQAAGAVEGAQTTVSPTPPLSPTPTPFDPNNHPPYSSPEYDAWKEQYEIWKADQDAKETQVDTRNDEWEANEEDAAWVEAHGGTETYYISGQWQADQDAAAAAKAAEEKKKQEELQQQSGPANSISADPQTTQSSIAAGVGSADNTAISVDNDNSIVGNTNNASITNGTTAGGISGENTQQANDGTATMKTGNVGGDGTQINQGNTNITDTDSFDAGASAEANGSFAQGSEAENLNTGDDTTNLAVASESDLLDVDNSNNVDANNQMTVEGTSGDNTLVDNDGNATLTTGDIELIANMLNILNLNVTGDDFLHLIVNIFGELNGNVDLDTIAQNLGYSDSDALEVIARNQNTGDNSTNEAVATSENTTDVANTNTATVNNQMDVTATSGSNDLTGNDGSASVVTGRIQILANLLNFINSNFTGEKWKFIMVNVFGSLTGDIYVPKTDQYLEGQGGGVLAQNTAGDNSTAQSQATSLNTTNVANDNGVALSNTINANGISGENVQNDNDNGANTTKTGGVDLSSQILNFLNFNITGNNWVFLVVNVMGTWMGQIVGFADKGTMDAPGEGAFAALSVGGQGTGTTQDAQAGGGDNSYNNATATSINNTNVANTNDAAVNNTMNINGISGQNTASQNQRGSDIQTGWVEIDANMLNIINMNITGRNWLVVFLNVFGDFTGDLFFGKPATSSVAQNTNETNGGRGGSSNNQNTQQDNTSNASTTTSDSEDDSTAATAVVPTNKKVKSNVLGTTQISTNTQVQDEQNSDFQEYVYFEETDESGFMHWPPIAFIIEKFTQAKSFIASVAGNMSSSILSFLQINVAEAKGGE
jgi:hypothetical protein